MLVNFFNQNINFAPKVKNACTNANVMQSKVTFGAGYDTFERSSAGIQSVSLSNVTWDEEGLSALLDDVCADVIKNNPIAEKLNIEKPSIIISKHTNGVAQYNFLTNNIAFSPNVKGDYCMCIAIGRDGCETNLGIFNRNYAKEIASDIRKDGYDVEILKLNNKEKEAYIKALVAHELRHCVQAHLMASTKGVKDEYFDFINPKYKGLEAFTKRAVELGCTPDEVDFPELAKDGKPYYKTYVPKEIIEEDDVLKFSTNEGDRRYLSTRGHLLASDLLKSENKDSIEHYMASPVEMDANNCALEYFLKLRKKPEYSGMRENVSNSIAQDFFKHTKKGISTMKNFGYPPLIKKEGE